MLIGGIDANQIVTDLMSLERIPLTALEQRKTRAEEAARAITGIRTDVDRFRLASLKLSESTSFARYTASSSDADAVTASVTGTAVPSTLSFSVDQLARAHGLRSVGTVAATTSQITTSSTISLARDGSALGIGAVRATAGLTAGTHDVSVTQASAAAVRRSDSALAASTTITGIADDQLNLEVDGVAATITIAAGTYTADELATAVDDALTAAGVAASASLDSDGRLAITTNREGSAASVQITGGTALGATNTSIDLAALAGTDAVIDVGGTTTTLTDVSAGSTVTVTTPDGDLELDLTGGLRVGDLDVETVSLGGGTLGEVVSAINGANAGISASAVRVGDNQWRLQLTSRTAGEDGEMILDTSVFSGIGGMVESSSAQNAVITIGDGAGAYSVESSTNTFQDVLGGVSLTVSQTTTSPVTIDVAQDNSAISKDVSAMVAAANTALANIKVQTRYGVDGGGNGALAGNGAVRRLADQLRAALSRPVDGVTGMVGADVGIEIKRDGTFTFNASKLEAALADDPDAVARFFGRDATSPAGVTFLDASAETSTGDYEIVVTTAATQATSARIFDGGGTATRLGIRVNGITTSVDITAGQSTASIVDAINDALESDGTSSRVVAETDATGLVLRAESWGTSGNFEINLDVDGAGTWDAVDGVNVEGTIDGTVASGSGRRLFLNDLVDSPAAGLSVQVDGGVTGTLGSVEYQPGLAARVAELTTFVLGDDGTLDTASDAQQRRIEDFNDQIDRFEDRLFIRETNMRRQWSNLQTLLEGLQQQGSWLQGQLASLPQINTGG